MPSLAAALLALPLASAAGCVAPGTCTPPATKYARVITGPQPGQQWNIAGGFCGAFSLQHAALAHGAWISQDLVRKANRDQPGPHHMHGDTTVGFEVMPSNVAYTAAALKLRFDEWDFTAPAPQAPAYLRWLKKHLAAGAPVAFFPICKGDSHECYPDSCPGGGHTDHVEAMYGLFSNHPLDDGNVYADDYILHTSDQDLEPYYRPLLSLPDTLDMAGNCAAAGAGFGCVPRCCLAQGGPRATPASIAPQPSSFPPPLSSGQKKRNVPVRARRYYVRAGRCRAQHDERRHAARGTADSRRRVRAQRALG
jgi:hypothetical protein